MSNVAPKKLGHVAKIPEEFLNSRIIGYLFFSIAMFVAFGLLTEMRMGHLRYVVYTDLADEVEFEHFNAEDGHVEWATVIFAVAAGILLIGAYRESRRLGLFEKPSHHVFLLLLIFSLFFYAGEEMSWGQRQLGFATPGFLRAINEQGEFTVHNIGIIHRYKDGVFAVAILLWGVILPPACVLFPRLRTLQRRFMFPIPPLEYVSLFAAAIGFRVVFKTLYGNFGQELLEMMFSIAVFFVAWRAVRYPRALFA